MPTGITGHNAGASKPGTAGNIGRRLSLKEAASRSLQSFISLQPKCLARPPPLFYLTNSSQTPY